MQTLSRISPNRDLAVDELCNPSNYSGAEHMWKGIPLELIKQSETALQNCMVNVWIHVENVGPNPLFYTYYLHLPV